MCGTRGSNPQEPHSYHLFIHSIHSPDNYFIYQILFIKFIYLFIYLFILFYFILFYFILFYLFIYSWCFDDLSDRALKPRGRNLSFGMSLCMRKQTIGVSDQV